MDIPHNFIPICLCVACRDVKIDEGISELIAITSEEIRIGKISYQQIPEPRELGIRLLKAAMVSLPEVLPHRDIKVATRKKLTPRCPL